MLFYVIGGIVTAIYLVIGVLLLIRSKNRQIISRSPILLYISHYSNLIAVLLILPIATALQDPDDKYEFFSTSWQLRECGIIMTHYLVYIPYVLRGYRLYFVFHLDKDWNDETTNFRKHNYRTKQVWLLKMLGYLMIPPTILCVFVIFFPPVSYYFPVSETHNRVLDEDVAGGFYVFVCFLEQLFLIYIVWKIRNITDDFSMTNELAWFTIFWFLTPFFSTFAQYDGGRWLLSILCRNVLIMIRSSLIPLILSYQEKESFESMTMDVLNSLELVLMNNLTLAAFEKFLTQDSVPLYSDSFTYEFFLQGLPLLDFYKKCVVFLNSPGQSSFSIVHNEYIENKNVIPSEIIEILEEGFEIENVERAKVSAFRILEQHFYPKFQMSEEYRELKRQIHKKEIFNFRVMQTSFHGIFYLVSLAKKKRVNSSTPRKRVESLL